MHAGYRFFGAQRGGSVQGFACAECGILVPPWVCLCEPFRLKVDMQVIVQSFALCAKEAKGESSSQEQH